MFGKLTKYEFRSYFKSLLPVWGAVLVLALINGFTLPRGDMVGVDGVNAFLTFVLPLMLFVISFIVMGVVTLVQTIERFWRGLLGNEGYLMFTLPVSRSQLIGSKLLVSVTVQLIGGVVICLSGVILALLLGREEFLEVLSQGFGFIAQVFREYPGESWTTVVIVLEVVVLALLGMANNSLHLYAAMSLGHLSKKQKVAVSVLAWVGLNVLFTNLTIRIGAGAANSLPSWLMVEKLADVVPLLFIAILISAIHDALYWALTELILKRKLNLE